MDAGQGAHCVTFKPNSMALLYVTLCGHYGEGK